MMIDRASLHRFHHLAAVSVWGEPEAAVPTMYLNAKQARKLARALYRIARSIENETFNSSTIKTINIGGE